VLGALRADLPDPAQITTSARLKDNPGAITRSRDFIDYPPGAPAWALIDFDTKGMPANVATSIEAAGGMWNALLTVAPGLQRAARVSRASTSSGLFRTDTGTQLGGSGGAHRAASGTRCYEAYPGGIRGRGNRYRAHRTPADRVRAAARQRSQGGK
jgi:hypothetical protein